MQPSGPPLPRPSTAREMIRAITLCAGAAIAALQPPKLLIGTMAVAFIAVVGSVLDAVGGDHYQRSDGLHASLEVTEIAEARAAALADYQARIPEEARLTDEPSGVMTPDEMRDALHLQYMSERAGLDEESDRARLESDYREVLARISELDTTGTFSAWAISAGTELGVFVDAILGLRPDEALHSLRTLIFSQPARAFADHPVMTVLIGLLLAFALALFGGAIARLDALDTGLGRKPTAWAGLEYAWAHIGTNLQTLLLPLAIVTILAGLAALLGIPFNIPYLDLIGAVLYGVAIIFGIVSTVLLVGFGVMSPMLLGAVAVERADAGDAIQRTWGVLFKRPAHVALLLGTALVAFAVGLALLDLVAVQAMRFASSSWGGIIEGQAIRGAGSIELLDFTFRSAPDVSTGPAAAASALLGFWETLVVSVVLGYVFSWFATLGSRLFLAMRYLVDRQSTSVIWVPGAIPGSTVRVPTRPEGAFAADDDYESGGR